MCMRSTNSVTQAYLKPWNKSFLHTSQKAKVMNVFRTYGVEMNILNTDIKMYPSVTKVHFYIQVPSDARNFTTHYITL